MRPKTTRILYWIVTLLFVAGMFFSGISEVLQTESSKAVMVQLGYPIYLNYIIGIAKILGALALLQTFSPILKEWAYAGFMIDFIGAGASTYFAGGGLLYSLFPAIFIAVMLWSRSLWKKVYSI